MRISDWSSDVCSSDLADFTLVAPQVSGVIGKVLVEENQPVKAGDLIAAIDDRDFIVAVDAAKAQVAAAEASVAGLAARVAQQETAIRQAQARSEEHTSELQSLMRISYAVFCLKKKKTQ